MKPLFRVERSAGMRRCLIAIVFVLAACGAVQPQPSSSRSAGPASPSSATPLVLATTSPSPSAIPSPTQASSTTPPSSPSPQPTKAAPLLFAALEAKGTTNPSQWNTLAIAGLDGYARAKTTFTPLPFPYVGCAGPIVPLSAHVAAGRVYFADGTGAIRSLSPNGQLVQVTKFPLTSTQQMLSFAVSPDGAKLLATIFTFPPAPPSPAACTGSSVFAPGSFTLDVYAADSGAPSTLLYHQDLGTAIPANVMELVGWDQAGPFGTDPSVLATQGGGPAHYYGTTVHIDATTGKVVQSISDQSCMVWDIAATGDFVCSDTSSGDISVRRPDRSEIWHFKAQANAGFYYEFLAPDEQHVVGVGSATVVVGRDGSNVAVAPSFFHDGWLDSQTLVGGGFNRNFSYVSLAAPGNVVDIGFAGLFIGTVQA